MKLRFIDGFVFTAETKRSACEVLWHSMRFRLYDALDEWMDGNAQTMHKTTGKSLRIDTPENHFDDMVLQGILVILSDDSA